MAFLRVVLVLLMPLLFGSFMVSFTGNFYNDFDITWGDGRSKILNNGELLTLSLDKAFGLGFQSRNKHLFGNIHMQIKLVPGNSAGTVAAYYLRQRQQRATILSMVRSNCRFSHLFDPLESSAHHIGIVHIMKVDLGPWSPKKRKSLNASLLLLEFIKDLVCGLQRECSTSMPAIINKVHFMKEGRATIK
ncbi:xyloglucan:xyloglucosyl transferase, putative [Ricinus communis]|uniref:Xyloglucan:xyloglucosyl transferase, putative n=1 Tax=Ricinus communis TaxID=3988 RepID=B9SME1_RICCO|nr:xyloglucan:xyloglucosyl transferase, putative [Ricinus communis]